MSETAIAGAPAETEPTWLLELKRQAKNGQLRRILAVRFARLGDLLFTTPALRLLHRAYPEASIDYLTTGYCREIVEHHPAVRKVLVHDRRWHRPGYRSRKRELVRQIANEKYDVAIVFEARGATRNMIDKMLGEAGIRAVISRSTFVGKPIGSSLEHACERHMALLSMLDLPPDQQGYELHFPDTARERARALLAEHGAAASDSRPLLVGFQAGCHYSMWPKWLFFNQRYKYHKTWPEESWSALATLLAERLGARPIITGAGIERKAAAQIARGYTGAPAFAPINLAGLTSVTELAALIAQLDLFITVDTGSMHMAAALGIPTVALFGPTNPRRHGPYSGVGGAGAIVVSSGIACSPCDKAVRKACPANLCMSRIHPEQVLAAASKLLQVPARGNPFG